MALWLLAELCIKTCTSALRGACERSMDLRRAASQGPQRLAPPSLCTSLTDQLANVKEQYPLIDIIEYLWCGLLRQASSRLYGSPSAPGGCRRPRPQPLETRTTATMVNRYGMALKIWEGRSTPRVWRVKPRLVTIPNR